MDRMHEAVEKAEAERDEAVAAVERVRAVCDDEWGDEAECECCPASSDAWVARPLITSIRSAIEGPR